MKPPKALMLEGNISENWRKWQQQFRLYLVASGIAEKSPVIQASTLLHVIGEDAVEIYNTFTWAEDGHAMVVSRIVEKFSAYCTPKKNVTYERHVFNTRNQKQGETIDQYITELRMKAKTCEFGTLNDSLIRDRVVCGIVDDKVRARLLRETDLTLQKAIDICRANEITSKQVKTLANEGAITADINAIQHSKDATKKKLKSRDQNLSTKERLAPRSQRSSQRSPTVCSRCGGKHGKQHNCPAVGATCHKCNKRNHY